MFLIQSTIDANDIFEMIFAKAKGIDGSDIPAGFLQDLKDFTRTLMVKLPQNATDVTNSSIMERNRKFKVEQNKPI